MKKEILLQTDKLCKTFSTGGLQQHVLKNLDLSIYKGDFTVIMGASGSGKSTLLYVLSGICLLYTSGGDGRAVSEDGEIEVCRPKPLWRTRCFRIKKRKAYTVPFRTAVYAFYHACPSLPLRIKL